MGDLTSSKKPMPTGLIVVSVLALGAAAVVYAPDRDEAATANPSPRASVSAQASASPFDRVQQLMDTQSAALLKGDEKTWLAPVDGKLHAQYKVIYRNLRALEVTHAEQRMDELPDMQGTAMTVRVKLGYCFSGTECGWHDDLRKGAPKLTYKLTWTPRGGSYAITAMAASGLRNQLQPAPWEHSALAFAAGKRVIVAAPASQAKHVRRVLPLAEKAAVVADRYAGYAGNQQKKYRVYIADDKSWNTWYSGAAPKWAVAYHLSLNSTGGDIVVKASEVMPESNRVVTQIIQHEFAHAVTLIGSNNSDEEEDLWLIEGIAEYIGSLPEKPQNSYNRDVLRWVREERGAPKTIALKPLTDSSDDMTVAALYATGHFAAGCMAEKYGERKLLDFVDRVLQYGEELDPASRAVYGQPFATVDKACVAWIRQRI